jgi:hypothetical protein
MRGKFVTDSEDVTPSSLAILENAPHISGRWNAWLRIHTCGYSNIVSDINL